MTSPVIKGTNFEAYPFYPRISSPILTPLNTLPQIGLDRFY
jgi:hypothetical protein